ncbi:uncharacterized protein METZ01_LOCUS431693 [marine metagenome]|uniref:Uncharacterized protein n=1 Tax=marine metagenome TaxID=408172 RepID=A0A382Y732_9ZZZZ
MKCSIVQETRILPTLSMIEATAYQVIWKAIFAARVHAEPIGMGAASKPPPVPRTFA